MKQKIAKRGFLLVFSLFFVISLQFISQPNTATFSYAIPPKPGTPAFKIKPIPHPPGPPAWIRGSLSSSTQSFTTSYQTKGTISAVNLAVDFNDKVATTSLSHYDDMLFDPVGYPDNITKSMRNYYREVSYYNATTSTGLDVTGEVYGKAKSDIITWIDWVRAYQSYIYYANNNGFGRYPRNAQRLTEDTVKATDPYVDFAKFTTYQGTEAGVSGTFVSALFIVHAGPGAEVTGNKNDIWSHAWTTESPIKTNDVTASGQPIYVYRYIMMAEDSPMGTFGHEFGHTLGLPDLYDYDGSSAGIGAWSMMAYGTWNDNGNTPAQMDAWSKVSAGWVNPTVITTATYNEIPQVEKDAVIYWLPTQYAQEYFLVENRQRILFDAALPGNGLLIWHIDDAITNNDNEAHYHVALEQADGKFDLEHWVNAGDSGDPYPGNTVNQTFNETSVPNSKSYTGASTNVSATQISDSVLVVGAVLAGNTGAGEIIGPLTVETWTDKTNYTLGEKVYITTKVTDEDGNPVAGAKVHVTILTPKPISYGWDQTTGSDGTTVFEFNPKWRGDYSTKSDATYPDGSSGQSSGVYFRVN